MGKHSEYSGKYARGGTDWHSLVTTKDYEQYMKDYEQYMAEINQRIYDRKKELVEELYHELPEHAQFFIDKYRDAINRNGRLAGYGCDVDELLNFVKDVKSMVEKTSENIFSTATKGVAGAYNRGSGV